MKPELMLVTFAVVFLYMTYAVQVRNGRIDGKVVLLAGLGLWVVGLGLTTVMIWPSVAKEGFRLISLNATTMTILTVWCVYMAWRSALIKDVFTTKLGETEVIVRSCTPWRIRGVDALLLPNSTALRSIAGPASSVLIAAGKGLEKEARALSPVKLEKVVMTSGGALSVPKVFHVAVHEPSKATDAVRLRRGIEAAAVQARKSGSKSLGVPIATLRGLSPKDTIEALVGGVLHQRKSFEKLVFVAIDSHDASLIRDAIEASVNG